MSRLDFVDSDYIQLLGKIKPNVRPNLKYLTPQEERLLGSTPEKKYRAQPYTPQILQDDGLDKLEETQSARSKLKYSVAAFMSFDVKEEEARYLHKRTGGITYLLISLPDINSNGKTDEDPHLIDKNGKLVRNIKKREEVYPNQRDK
ncbi:MAG: hypothetical protein ABIG20_03530 [archaeon]